MVTADEYLQLSATQRKAVKAADIREILAELITRGNVNDIPDLNADRDEDNGDFSNADIMKEIRDIKKDIKEILELKETVKAMRTELDTAYDIINNQMRFMESVDSRDRAKKLIITGLKESSVVPLGKLVYDVINASGFSNERLQLNENTSIMFIDNDETVIKRLGKPRTNPDPNRPRAILIELPCKKNER